MRNVACLLLIFLVVLLAAVAYSLTIEVMR
jgi:hypothetical protein